MPPLQRQGRLRPEFAHLYPGLRPDVWVPARALTEWVRARLGDRPAESTERRPRILDPAHFVFRTVAVGLPSDPDEVPDAAARPGRAWSLEEIAVRGPLQPITQQARVARARPGLPADVEPGRWYDVFGGPFPLELEQSDQLYLVMDDAELRGVPRAWCEVRDAEP